jgi:hypothetical protein
MCKQLWMHIDPRRPKDWLMPAFLPRMAIKPVPAELTYAAPNQKKPSAWRIGALRGSEYMVIEQATLTSLRPCGVHAPAPTHRPFPAGSLAADELHAALHARRIDLDPAVPGRLAGPSASGTPLDSRPA